MGYYTMMESAKGFLPNRVKTTIKNLIAKSNKPQRVPSDAGTPLVSVIVPVYNVSQFVADCLNSITEQTYQNIEIVVINDGSTDDSLAIVEGIASRDKRISIYNQKNAGLGAARNRGVQYANGKYLAFVDSDDVVPPRAYEMMVKTLEKSGSDFVTGTYHRFNSTGIKKIKWMEKAHASKRTKISIKDYRDGFVNVYAWNKLYRKSTWERLGLEYTEGVRYEDQEPTTQLMLRAKTFDVIPDSVYAYREREDNSSITQTKHLYKDITDRLKVIKHTAKTVEKYGDKQDLQAWLSKLIRYDLIPYVRSAADAGEEYQNVCQQMMSLVRSKCDIEVILDSPVKNRALIALVADGKWESVGNAVLWNDSAGAYLPTTILGENDVRFEPPYASDLLGADDFALKLGNTDLELVCVVTSTAFVDSKLYIDGWAIAKNIDDGEIDYSSDSIKVTAISEDGVEIELDVIRRADSNVTAWSRSRTRDLTYCGFTASAEIGDLVPQGNENCLWRFSVSRKAPQINLSNNITRRAGGFDSQLLDSDWEKGDRHARFTFNPESGLLLAVTNGEPSISASVQNNRLIISMDSSLAPARLSLKSRGETVKLQKSTDGISSNFICPVASLTAEQGFRAWRIKLSGGPIDGVTYRLSGSSRCQWLSSDLALRLDEKEHLFIDASCQRLVVDEVLRVDDEIVLHGTETRPGFGIDIDKIALIGEDGLSSINSVNWTDGRFSAVLPLVDVLGSPLPFSSYKVRVFDSEGSASSVASSISIRGVLGSGFVTSSRRVVISKTNYGNISARLAPPLADDEVGRFNQTFLQLEYQQSELPIDQSKVILNAYLGGSATDSSLAIAEELSRRFPDMDLVWSVESPTVAVPEGMRKSVIGTRSWYRDLATAGTIIHNIYFDPWFQKKHGQVFIQTWHGTPLKTVNHSYWSGIGRSDAWIGRMDKQAEQWDYLISPSPYYTDILCRESNYYGRVLEVGYPRNDVLVDPLLSDSIRRAARRKLGVGDSDIAVLYAPTWRDSRSSASWKAKMVDFFDPSSLVNELGDGYKLLMRGHGHNARESVSREYQGNVVDVTHYESINELYLAADVVVTDYSSVMFDVVVPRKPLVIYAPDYSEYVSSPRGVYFDLEKDGPSQLVFDTESLIDILASGQWKSIPYLERYGAFVDRFAPYDDGNAAKRVVEAIWGP
jgi:CDP-glycerol glycerophosphotransferase